ncbi:hypothetical protein Lal_00045271 [Lupinus albus]|nr:hypothetical protein Lal_00045271 [Lupinus albus]
MAKHVREAKIMSDISYILFACQCAHLNLYFKLIRRQFPIVVSYTMTTNKSQWQSLESVDLYLPRPLLSHSQLYATISRV